MASTLFKTSIIIWFTMIYRLCPGMDYAGFIWKVGFNISIAASNLW